MDLLDTYPSNNIFNTYTEYLVLIDGILKISYYFFFHKFSQTQNGLNLNLC